MKIIVDYNNDIISIDEKMQWKIKEPSIVISILEEILNELNVPGTELILIDEDTSRTIGEW